MATSTRSVRAFEKFSVHATDGKVGKIGDVYFDDERWVVRYMVVDTDGWLAGRSVLLSPVSVSAVDDGAHAVHVRLSRERIQNSPGIETHRPVSRQQEEALYHHYGYPYYWGGPYAWGHALLPSLLERQIFEDPQRLAVRKEVEDASEDDRHLRSCNDVRGYRILARDGRFGHVEDFLIDEDDWAIRYLVVDPFNYWPGPGVLVPAERIAQVYWSEQEVMLDMQRDEVEHAPAWDPGHPPPSRGAAGRTMRQAKSG